MEKMDLKEVKQYWIDLAKHFNAGREKDPYALSIVCHPGMPPFVNRYFDYFQRKSIKKALNSLGLNFNGRKVLDVGCGGGRICSLFHSQGTNVTGIDIQNETIAKNKELFPDIEFLTMSATELDFPDSSFDFVSAVTVLQHLPYDDQLVAIGQIARVLKSKGYFLLLEWTRKSTASHMSPRIKADWIKLFKNLGLQLIYSKGIGFDLIFRTLNVILYKAKFLLPVQYGSQKIAIKQYKNEKVLTLRNRVRRALSTIVVIPSYPVEFLCELFISESVACHSLMIFQKI